MKTKNIAVGALVGLLTLALWWNFLLKPSRSEASKVKAETETERAKLPPLEAQVAQANLDASHAAAFKSQLTSLRKAVPDSPELANFIRDANALAEASNIQWQSVTHGPPVPGDAGVATITLGIQVKGTYEQVMDYLARLAKANRLVVVDSVQFSAAGTTGAGAGATGGTGEHTGPFSGASQLTVTISARMFETPEALAAATGTDPTTGLPTTPGATGSTGGSAPALNNS